MGLRRLTERSLANSPNRGIVKCPACGYNPCFKVTDTNYYCMGCYSEFTEEGTVYVIAENGMLSIKKK